MFLRIVAGCPRALRAGWSLCGTLTTSAWRISSTSVRRAARGCTSFLADPFPDTETDLGNGLVGPDENSPEYGGPFGAYTNQQVDWLQADLAAVNRSVTPWIVVFGHRGWYLSSSSSACANCQTAFENLLLKYGAYSNLDTIQSKS
jgi:hypothetical protein